MAKPMTHLLLLLIFFSSAKGDYNVLEFGAKPDGKSDSTRPFLSAWASACSSNKPATISVPSGRYLLKRTTFQGPCRNQKITFQIKGTIVAPSDYRALGTSGYWLLFNSVQGVSIYGGTLDARGKGLWACKRAGGNCPQGARSLTFNGAKDVVIQGLKSINSQFYHIGINRCNNLIMRSLNIVAPERSPNTDGIHIQKSTEVTITGTGITTGDDCISIGPGTTNMWVENVACGPGHGISIGSLAQDFQEEGVQNITVKSAVFTGTQNGLRIKSWARPSNGFVRGVRFQHVVMKNVRNPIIIDQNYCPGNRGCPGQHSGVKITKVTFTDIKGTSATPIAVKFDCSPKYPCSGIGLQDIKLTYQNQPAQSSCKNVGGIQSSLRLPPSCF